MRKPTLSALLILSIGFADGCKTGATRSEAALLDASTSTSAVQLTGKGAERLFDAIAEGDRLDNDGRGKKKWENRGGSSNADEGFLLGSDSEYVGCERKGSKYSCSLLLKAAMVRSPISRVIVSGQLSLQPQPVTAADAAANMAVTTEWIPVGGKTTVDSNAIKIEGSNSGWKVSDLNYPVYTGNDARILCGLRGVGLSDTACLFVVKKAGVSGNQDNNSSPQARNLITLDLTAYDKFSIGIQNVLYQGEKKHPDIIGSKQENNHGRFQYYKGKDASFGCYSFKCEFTPSPWQGDLAIALKSGMTEFGVQIVGNKLAGPHIFCEGAGSNLVCHYRFEDNPFLSLQEALKATSAVPSVSISSYDPGSFNVNVVKKKLQEQFQDELPGCTYKASASIATALADLKKQVSNDVRVSNEIKTVRAGVNAGFMVRGVSGDPCASKYLFEFYHTNGYKIQIAFEQ